MNRISQTFQQLHLQNKKALIPYITPEFPVQGTTVPLLRALESAGASLIEIGIPFSDPLADGPTIQHSSEVAIKNGVTVPKVFELVKEARKKTDIPFILMGYVNSLLHYGMEKFLSDANQAGVDGLIIPDLLPDESEEYRILSKKYSISNVFLIAPTTPVERIRFIDEVSTDFTYCVSVTGVTGARNSLDDELGPFLSRVQKNTTKPFVVGFGIKSKDQVSAICKIANGAVIGSALLQSMEGKKNVDEAVLSATTFFTSLV